MDPTSPALQECVNIAGQGLEGQEMDRLVDRCPLVTIRPAMPQESVPGWRALRVVRVIEQHMCILDSSHDPVSTLVQGLTLPFGLDQSAQSLGSNRPGWACEVAVGDMPIVHGTSRIAIPTVCLTSNQSTNNMPVYST